MTTSTTPAPDPYAVLGVPKDATAAEIRTSYKKLALKCHPDRIQDEAKRDQGKDEFQKVQEAYELLSDEHKRAKYDLKVQQAAEARKSTPTDKGSSSSSSSYFKTTSFEYRGGKLYEEKTFVRRHDDEPAAFSEEPRTSSRKYDGYERKHSAKEPEEKRKSKPSESSSKSKLRESIRSSRKSKDKERKREQSEKQTRNAYTVTDDESQPERDYTRSPRQRPSLERREDSSKFSSTKYVVIEDNALGYIQRSKAAMSPEPERRGSYPMSSPPVYYDSLEAMVGDTARRSAARPLRRSGPDLRGTYEVADSPLRGRPTPRKAASASNGIRVATGSRGPARAPTTTTYEVKSSKGIPTLRRAETAPHPPHVSEPLLPRSSRPAERRYDSGYSSPGTPDFHGSPPKSSSKFTIIDEDDDFPRRHRTVIVEQPYRRHQSVSPSRRMTPIATLRATSRPAQTRGRTVPSMRTESARVIPTRGSPPLRHGSTGLFGEVSDEYKFTPEQVRYSPRIRQEDVRFTTESYRPGVMRKESYAY